MAKASLLRRGLDAVFSEAAWQVFWAYGFSPLVTGAAVAAGIIEHFPLMWIIMAASLTFVGMSLGVLSFDRWLFVQSAEHKVTFQRVAVNRSSDQNSLVLGVVLKNIAQFPIDATLTKMAVSCASRIPDQGMSLPKTLHKVDSNNEFFFNSALINLVGVTADPMIALMDITIAYGRPQRRQYTLSYAQKVSIPIDATKPFVASAFTDPKEQAGGSVSQ